MPPPNRNGPTFLAKKIAKFFGTLQSSLLVLEIIILMGEYKNSLIFRFEREIDQFVGDDLNGNTSINTF